MLCRDLILPNGTALQLGTDKIIPASEAQHPFFWDGLHGLSGNGSINNWTQNSQPYLGCPTGGDVVADLLMRQLGRERLKYRKEGDNDARWQFYGG